MSALLPTPRVAADTAPFRELRQSSGESLFEDPFHEAVALWHDDDAGGAYVVLPPVRLRLVTEW